MTVTKDIVVGYIGLGLAGGPLAENIFKNGYKTLVRDADEQRQRDFVAKNKGLPVSAAPAGPDGFKEADVVITMVPNGHVVREILLGPQGIAPRLKPGTTKRALSATDKG